jgi:hypothetical protein
MLDCLKAGVKVGVFWSKAQADAKDDTSGTGVHDKATARAYDCAGPDRKNTTPFYGTGNDG